MKSLAKILANRINQKSQKYFFSLKIKFTVLLLLIFTYLSKIDEISGKNYEKSE